MLKTSSTVNATQLEDYFAQFREHIVGIDATIDSNYGTKPLVYADWTASGRMYTKIENTFRNNIYPFVANTHTETNFTGSAMTKAYAKARQIIKAHVNACDTDILISSNSGMTGVVNKFQRILGLKIHEKYRKSVVINDVDRPVIFVTHMEHHSNQTSWLETVGEVVIIAPCPKGLVCLEDFEAKLDQYKDRKYKIAAVTSCSNVTGIKTPYHQIAKLIHQVGGLCFVDFACSAPYIDIDMHPTDEEERLDAIYFSPHKFLGGPSSAGVLIFNQKLYNNRVPDTCGGGTVDWTNPWGEHKYYDAIEAREDGGTPSFLQTMRTALSIMLKEQMNTDYIAKREAEITEQVFEQLNGVENLHILAGSVQKRLPVFSFYIENLHYNLGVKLLNDRYGIQTRGGCSCAGTYGHYLLDVSQEYSKNITNQINQGIFETKPGWIRASFHPTMTTQEVEYICDAIKTLAANHQTWAADYDYHKAHNDFKHKDETEVLDEMVDAWFE